ncbi:helix-turn-helix domain-containing protein [Candidatus Berkelbacteria bacterium]|nr:helix-turn-helix domain-containing protein [Candidatus Berkelbacteria bacterium]
MSPFTKKRLSAKQRLGTKLARARKRHGADLRVAERETRIACKYLQALEDGRYGDLPASVYVRGFLIRYAAYLGLRAEVILADYAHESACYQQAHAVRSSKQAEAGVLRPRVAEDWLKQQRQWYLTPGVLWGSTASVFLVGVLGYLWFQVTSFAAAPPLDVVTPGSEIRVSVEQVEVAGITDPAAELRINDQVVAVDAQGHFRQPVQLMDGVNTIEISAQNRADKETVKTIQLLADIPEPTLNDQVPSSNDQALSNVE